MPAADDRFDAEVWLLDMASRLVIDWRAAGRGERLQLLKLVHYEATGLPPELVLPSSRSAASTLGNLVAGAQGCAGDAVLAGRTRPTARQPHHIATNLRFGCTILRHYLDIEKATSSVRWR